jgi:hypothetical protein
MSKHRFGFRFENNFNVRCYAKSSVLRTHLGDGREKGKFNLDAFLSVQCDSHTQASEQKRNVRDRTLLSIRRIHIINDFASICVCGAVRDVH